MSEGFQLEDAQSDLRTQVIERLAQMTDVGDNALVRARQLGVATGLAPEQALNRLGVVSDEQLAQAYAEVLGLDPWDATGTAAFEDPEGRLSGDYLKRHGLLPVRTVDGVVEIAAQDPLNVEGLRGVGFALGATTRTLVARVSDLREALDTLYPTVRAPAEAATQERAMRAEIDRVEDETLSSDAVSIVTRAVAAAMRRRASDIHIEPRQHELTLRLRIDGELVNHRTLDRSHAEAVVTRVKVLAGLDLGERRLPQDGRASVLFEGRNVELRVSVVPSVHGETAVLRILDRNEMATSLESLGFGDGAVTTLKRAASAPSGVFLVSGPTGSGKTTTLYAMLNQLKGSRRKILSVEDPVEYRFDHVIQVQAAPQIGLTFATALRSFLRQDPDVLLIGEIRDAETAEIAFQAAMTGHLVLASIHANDAVRVVSRLRDLQSPGHQVAAALIGASAQRLVRKLCLACREEAPLSAAEQAWCGARGLTLHRTWKAGGCIACDQEGYVGRTVISEHFLATPPMADAIANDLSADQLRTVAVSEGFALMDQDASPRIEAGQISLADVMRVVGG